MGATSKGSPPLRPGHNDSSGRGGYSLRDETVLEAQRLREEQEAKAATVVAAKRPPSPRAPISRRPSLALSVPLAPHGL